MTHFARHSRHFPVCLPLLALIILPACTKTGDSGMAQRAAVSAEPDAAQRYLGQTPPGDTPELFAPGLVSTDAVELNSVFSPDGQLLYFMGAHPVEAGAARTDLNPWVSRRVDGAWAVAEPLPTPLNTGANEVYSSMVADGSLYFSSNRPGSLAQVGTDLYRAQRLADGTFGDPVHVGPPISGTHGVGDTFVAPDESYLILSSRGLGGNGAGDLFVSFRLDDGGWGAPLHLGPDVNSEFHEYCPTVTPDGRYLFFSRRRSEPADSGWPGVVQGDVFWVDASVIERLRQNAE